MLTSISHSIHGTLLIKRGLLYFKDTWSESYIEPDLSNSLSSIIVCELEATLEYFCFNLSSKLLWGINQGISWICYSAIWVKKRPPLSSNSTTTNRSWIWTWGFHKPKFTQALPTSSNPKTLPSPSTLLEKSQRKISSLLVRSRFCNTD